MEKKLEIVLITYNRSEYLENTLSQVIKSPFAKCKITILDNCSTDNTSEVCKKYQKLFHNMKIIRHKHNIGGNANILRAAETSNSLYTWILADDDILDFSDCSDFIDAIDSEKYDVILNTFKGAELSNGKTFLELLKEFNSKNNNSYLEISAKRLFNLIKHEYFLFMGFIPSFIFKTELWDSECLMNGYDNIRTLFPHFSFINKSYEEDFSLYITKNDIVTMGRNTEFEIKTYSFLDWTNGWLDASMIIKNPKTRKIVACNYHNTTLIPMIIFSVIRSKAFNEENFKNKIISLASSVIKIKGFLYGFFIIILLILLSLIPRQLCKYLNKKIEAYIKRNIKKMA